MSLSSTGNRGSYANFTPEQKAEIARYAVDNSNVKTCTKFSQEYGKPVKESTVRQYKKDFLTQIHEGKSPEQITALHGKKRGRPSTKMGSTTTLSSGSAASTPTKSGQQVSSSDLVGEIAILSCISDLMNGGETEKPVVLVVACSDGNLESHELSSLATVKSFPHLIDSAHLTDELCQRSIGMIIGSQCLVNRTLLDRCPKLRIIIRQGMGTDNIDVEYAGRLGVVVCNVPDYGIEEVADTAMSHILSLYRRTTFLHNAVHQGKRISSYDDVASAAKGSRRIRGKTLGLIGLGKTGIAVAQRAKAFGFNVCFYDPFASDGLEKAVGGLEKLYSLPDVVKKSDCVSLHCMLTEENRHIIDDNLLKLFKKGSFLVNVARGALIDEAALARALTSGKLGGAALDVHETEPFSFDTSPLKGAPNLICTPHIAWFSKESLLDLKKSAIKCMKIALSDMDVSDIRNCVNKQYIDVIACQARWTATM